MSNNQNLYNKYRPMDFNSLVGQDSLVKVLKGSISRGKVATSYLLCGPRGLGKTTTARIIAKSLNCSEGLGEVCGVCNECVGITNGTSPNVLEIDAASNGSVETVRTLIIERIKFKPTSRYRVIILDECHALSTSASNALLKVLEEGLNDNPVVFIFATTDPQKVLGTILSRVQRFDLKSITNEDIVGRLRYIAEQEEIEVSDDVLFKIAKSSGGGMRDSISKMDQLASFEDGVITDSDADSVLGMVSEDSLLEVIKAVSESDVLPILNVTNDIISTGKNMDLFYNDITNAFDTLMKINLGIDVSKQITSNQFSDDFITSLTEYKGVIKNSQVIKLIKTLLDNERNLKFSPNKQLVIANIFNNVFNGSDLSDVKIPDLDGVLKRVAKLEEIINSGALGERTTEVRNIVSGIKDKIKTDNNVPDGSSIDEMEKAVAMEELDGLTNGLVAFFVSKTGGEVV